MKIYKKILPFASLLGVGAIITPLITSCGNGWMESLDYKSKYEPMKENTLTEDQATVAYFNEVLENNDLFVDDFYYISSLVTKQYVEMRVQKYGKCDGLLKARMSNVKIKKETHGGKDYYLMSFVMEQTIELNSYGEYIDQEKGIDYKDARINEYRSMKWEYNSTPWEVRDIGREKEVWVVQTILNYKYGSWRVRTIADNHQIVYANLEDGIEKYTVFDKSFDRVFTSEDEFPVIPPFTFQSHHLENIKNQAKHPE